MLALRRSSRSPSAKPDENYSFVGSSFWANLESRQACAVRLFFEQWLNSCWDRLTYRVIQVLTEHGCFGEYLS